MPKILLGTICGIVFGAISVATMIPLDLPDKRLAMAGAFVNRFAIGFTLGATNLPVPGWANGLLFGLLLSLADAIITKSCIPIMALGAVGGVICGFVIGAFGV